MPAAITAIGNAIPLHVQSQAKTFEFMASLLGLTKVEKRIFKTIYREAGIESRQSVLEDFAKLNQDLTFYPNDSNAPFPSTKSRMQAYQTHALPLASAAIADCFSSNNVDKNTITHIITVSCTGMAAPGLDIALINHLKLLTTIHRTAINFMGCYGAINGLKAAHAICTAYPDAKVLVVSLELCTLHFQKTGTIDSLIANALFSDGAAAAIIENNPSTQPSFIFDDFYCDILAKGHNAMTWEIGDQGFDIKLSTYVPQLVEEGINDFFQSLLKKDILKRKKIDFYAIHPGGKKILEACERALNLSTEDNASSYEILKRYGNMSSATILFVLKNIMHKLKKSDHQKNIFSCAFGPGLTLESMRLTINSA